MLSFYEKNGSFIDSFNESCFACYVTFEKLSFSSMFYVKGFICFIFIFDAVCGYMCVCFCICVWVSMYGCVRGGRGHHHPLSDPGGCTFFTGEG